MAKVNYLYLLKKYKFHSDAVEVQLDNLSNELSISNRQINELGEQNSRLQLELITKEKYISLADEQLLSVRQTVAGQNSSIHELTAECRDHKRLQVVVNDQNALITRLKEELSIYTCNEKPPDQIDVLIKNNQEMEATLIQKNLDLARLQLKDKEVEIERLKTKNAKLTESNESYFRKLSELKSDGGKKKKKSHTSNFFLLDDNLSQKSSNLIMDFSYDHVSGDEATHPDEGSELQNTADVLFSEVSERPNKVLEAPSKSMRKASAERNKSGICPKKRLGMASKKCTILPDEGSKLQNTAIECDTLFREVSEQTNKVDLETHSKSMKKASADHIKSIICPKKRVKTAPRAREESEVLPKSAISFDKSNSKIPRHTTIVREYLINKPIKDVTATSFNENRSSLPASRTLKSSLNYRISVLKSKFLTK